ncbi:hypothetical protein JX265_007397 [Neoarthrinium moseri]|uniref:MARVEL domain-containing protein n=1 Tax=Neoarthrinium moseri TaxID=1658444 RepID=A0A9P9WKF5_9PEZI|nr:hypothetical protein JX266_010244 [Neoarthrinium moseri]KAI1867595.1 hypothetical protein JX265_007397 [Neoarthrinium moseri]
MRFQAPQLGALGVTFTALRAAQFLSLVAIIGLTANFINEIVTAQRDAPGVLIGTLTVASTASLYIAITYILYYDGLLPLLIAGVFDFLLLIATIVVAATVGKPLSKLTCEILPAAGTSTITSGSTFVASTTGVSYRSILTKAVDYFTFVAVDQPHCYEIKAVWGLSIALCVLFAFSCLICIGLWRRVKSTSAAAPKDIEGVSFDFVPPPHQIHGGDRSITGPLALSSRSLGTGTLHSGPAASHPTLMPSPSVPPQAQAAPILRSIDEDIQAVPPPPPMIYVHRASRGRSLTAQRKSLMMPIIPESPKTLGPPAQKAGSPTEDFIPIIHKRVPQKIQTKFATPPSTPSDDGFTPITPAPSMFSPKLKTRAPPLISPRDALGIPISKIKSLARSKSRNGGDADDLEPLSPSVARDLNGLPVPVQSKEKPKRRTVWGIIDGWWDLGLLERGKSLRRK